MISLWYKWIELEYMMDENEMLVICCIFGTTCIGIFVINLFVVNEIEFCLLDMKIDIHGDNLVSKKT